LTTRASVCTFAAGGACDGSTGSYRSGCRLAPCRKANAAYKRKRRTQSVPERSKTRKPVTDSVVVQMPTARATTQPAAPDGTPGEQEQAVIAQLETIDCKDVALVARCRKMAEILDDSAQQGHWVQASKSLDVMMTRAQTGRKKKGNQGKLAILQAMSAPRRDWTGAKSGLA
jgi:hypothetical protein